MDLDQLAEARGTNTVGQGIRDARHHLGYSLTELATLLGVTRQAVSKWELDRTRPDPAHARLLTAILRQTIEN